MLIVINSTLIETNIAHHAHRHQNRQVRDAAQEKSNDHRDRGGSGARRGASRPDRKSTRLNSSHVSESRMAFSAWKQYGTIATPAAPAPVLGGWASRGERGGT